MNGIQVITEAIASSVRDTTGPGANALVGRQLFGELSEVFGGASLTGGLHNPQSGLGGMSDKTVGSYFRPTVFGRRQSLDWIFGESWAAEKVTTIPITDMFLRWRIWDEENEAMAEVERRHRVRERMWAMGVAGRLYGTGIACLMTTENDLATPLDPEGLQQGSLSNIFVADKFSAEAVDWIGDPYDPDYGQPAVYRVSPVYSGGEQFDIHSSRVIRFDGKRMPTESWSYGDGWGLSILVASLPVIMQEAETAQAVAHLIQEFNIPVIRSPSMREGLAGGVGGQSVQELALQVSALKSVFRTIHLDKEAEFQRDGIPLAGLPDVMDRQAGRMAAANDIPQTRLMGMSPAGMNATGESDAENYAKLISGNQESFREPMAVLDVALAKEAGLDEPPTYKWPSIMEVSDQDEAEAFKLLVEGLGILIDKYAIDEDELRAAVSGNPLVGDLEGPAPGAPDEMEMMEQEEEIKARFAPPPPAPAAK